MTKLAAIALIALPLAAQQIQNLEGKQNVIRDLGNGGNLSAVHAAFGGGLPDLVPHAQSVSSVGGDRTFKGLYISQSALIGATALDALSTRGGYELNPILGRGDFRMSRQGAIAIGATGAMVALQWWVVRKWPKSERFWKWFNFAGAGIHGAAAVHNWRME